MTMTECLRLLELGESATHSEIKRAYRRLAHACHPDRQTRDPTRNQANHERFVAISQAYRQLIQATRAAKQGKPIGTCCHCGEFGSVILGLDRQLRCDSCALRSRYGGRLLPLPSIVIVRCAITILLMLATGGLLFLAYSSGTIYLSWAALGTGFASLFSLAFTCISVVHCVNDRNPNTRPRA